MKANLSPSTSTIQSSAQTAAGVNKPNKADAWGHQLMTIASPTSAFTHEVMIAQNTPMAQVDFVFSNNAELVKTATVGSGSISNNSGMATLQTGASSSSTAIMAIDRAVKYRAGQGGMALFTAMFTAGVTDSRQIAGVGDYVNGAYENGYFFGYFGANFCILRKKSNVFELVVTQASWNVDTMDGSGDESNPSGMWLDPTKGNAYKIEYQYLGFGQTIFYVETPNGYFTPVHYIDYPNANTTPAVRNPTFRVLWEVANAANTSNLTLSTGAGAGFVQGVPRLLGPRYSVGNTKTSVGTTLTNVLTLKNAQTFNSVTNTVDLYLKMISMAVDGTKPAEVWMIKNATLGGTPSYTDVNTNVSVTSYDTAGTTVTGGREVARFALGKSDSKIMTMNDFDHYATPTETVTFAARATSSTTDVSISTQWIEDL